MCCSRDAGMTMINMSIDLAEKTGDASYYMDSMKLHKLLYLSQYTMLQTYGRRMFAEKITAHSCGPYVDGIKSIPAMRGFGLILERFHPENDDLVYPSVARLEILEQTLEEYGKMTTEELIRKTKGTDPYKEVADQITETDKPEITVDSMKKKFSLLQVG